MGYEIDSTLFTTWSKPDADYSKLFIPGKCPVCGSNDIVENKPKDLDWGGSQRIDAGSMKSSSTSTAHYVCPECGAVWDVKTKCIIEISIPYSAMWNSNRKNL